jgi:hypothetical protein
MRELVGSVVLIEECRTFGAKACGGRFSGGCDRVEGGGPEIVQDVVGAAGELAGDGQRRAGVAESAGLEREVVGVVGAAGAACRKGGFIERPAQLRGAWRVSLPARLRRSERCTPMSMPAIRTALREADRRPTSPSSQSVTSDVSSPIP